MSRRNQNAHKAIIGVVAAVLLIGLFGATLYYFEYVAGDKNEASLETDDSSVLQVLHIGDADYQITHNLETYLLMGTDESGNPDAQGTMEYRGNLADFLYLIVIDRTDGTYGFLPINRNTVTDVRSINPDGTDQGILKQQICEATCYDINAEKGCSNAVWAVSNLLGGIAIDGYYTINASQVGALNHAVGGVEVTIEDDMTTVDPAMQKGATLVLSDEQAEKFVRARMEVGEGDNASRMRRQDQFVKGFQQKSKQLMKSDPSFLSDLYTSLGDGSITDIPGNRISVITNQIYKGDSVGDLKIEGEATTGYVLGDGMEHEEFYPTEDSIAKVMCTLCGIDEDHVIKGEEE